LVCLKKAVGQDVDLDCRCPVSPVGDEFQVNTYTTDVQFRARVAADAQGNFVAAWTSVGSSAGGSSYSVLAQRLASDGVAVGTEFEVNGLTGGYHSFPAVAAYPDGDFVVVWDSVPASPSENTSGIRARRFDASGAPVGTELQVNTFTPGAQDAAAVAVDPNSGAFVVVWESAGSSGTDQSNFSIQGQRFDANGDAVGTEFQVNTLTTGSQGTPVVAYGDDGAFLVLWATLAGSGTDPDANVRGQLFGPDGAPESTEFRLNSYTTGSQGQPAIAPDGAGGFVAVWNSAGSPTDSDGAIAARLVAGGGQLGSEFTINSYTTGVQSNARVSALNGSRFVVTWRSPTVEDDDAIVGQVFDRHAIVIGTEFSVNSYTTGVQAFPDVAAQPDGNFVVVWQSEGSAGSDSDGYAIQAQRFE
jgi:hypothetical protein